MDRFKNAMRADGLFENGDREWNENSRRFIAPPLQSRLGNGAGVFREQES